MQSWYETCDDDLTGGVNGHIRGEVKDFGSHTVKFPTVFRPFCVGQREKCRRTDIGAAYFGASGRPATGIFAGCAVHIQHYAGPFNGHDHPQHPQTT